ncbi:MULTISPECIES: hypothetical protein [unclassified Nostoc]|uniref:hypothetical protein n=1 Tax=unclassified Nostoc TaxID=2593658 RepID=UPI0025D318A0|nr:MULTISPECIES: hypothetical protein [unclassified Nostoc]
MQRSHCGEAAPVLAVPVVRVSRRELEGLPFPLGLLPRGDAKNDGVSPSGFGSPSLLGQQDRATSPSGASGVETTGV